MAEREECLEWPAWRSARIVYEVPLPSTFLITDRGWHYYFRGGETFALRAAWNKTNPKKR